MPDYVGEREARLWRILLCIVLVVGVALCGAGVVYLVTHREHAGAPR
ncbi:hypothetical protein AB0M43_38655 [Longispora sp. NPDC051575]